ncbi:MAG: glycosyltransferase [Bacteroidia bacterium]|nr:glycosyltransferase [Bacteroidia bacterium]MCZ2248955.1 glycosyltransferase [Bacteroidia bacterium]
MIIDPKQESALVFTLFYPYTSFDYYVDIEIEMLCNKFKTVYIVPSNIVGDLVRPLPANAILLNIKSETNGLKFKKFVWLSTDYVCEIWEAFKQGKLNFTLFKHISIQFKKVAAFKRLLQSVFAKDKDLHFVYSHWMLEGAYAAAFLKKSFNFIQVSKAHSLDIYKERHIKNYIPFLKSTVVNINQIHFISQVGMNYFKSNYNFGIEASKLFVSRLGIRNTREYREYISTDTLRIISVCYIYPLKRVELILAAIAEIDEFKVEWHHIGAYYPEHTDKLKQEAQVVLKQHQNLCIHWVGDLSVPEVYEYYNNHSFDLFVSTSSSEGIPVSMMECMSFGIPVVSTNVGGVAEIVEHQKNGFLLDSNVNPKAIAQYLRDYYYMAQHEKSRYRLNAYNKWKTEYNADVNYKKFIDKAFNRKE